MLRSLPNWFGIVESFLEYLEAIDRLPTILAVTESDTIGFMSVEQHFDNSFELHVLAVRSEWQRRGVGRALLGEAEAHVAREGGGFLQVKTLSARRECEFYRRTRLWYQAMGFEPLTEFLTLWGEDYPCLQLMKVVSTKSQQQ